MSTSLDTLGEQPPVAPAHPEIRQANGSVADMVTRSWQRCRRAGLDPHAPRRPVKLDRSALASVLEANGRYVEAALPSMMFLESAVGGTGFILVLTDRANIVLRLFGDEAVVRKASENNYVPGCCRSEEDVGTNSIALASIERVALQLSGPDHYNIRHRKWTCSSAPVFAPDGEFLGTVTLSGDCAQAHRHTLGMVIAAAEAIQNRLRELYAEDESSRSKELLNSLLKSVTDAIVTIDADGIVTHVSRQAEQVLACREKSACGHSIGELFEPNVALRDVLAGRRNNKPLEVAREIEGRRVFFYLKPLVNLNDNALRGGVLAVTGRREFIDSVRRVSGLTARYTLDDVIGNSDVMRAQVALARLAATRRSRVLISGETGTGKELFAQGIHNASTRADGPFVAINCAAIPRELIEAELVGYGEGAFTSARKGGQIGKFELADGGTLFLDEISQMPLDLQAKLLRILEEGMVTRLGEAKPVEIDVRVVAATNEKLFEKCERGEFRTDLYFRLGVVEIDLPPLRERGSDLDQLCSTILEHLKVRLDSPQVAIAPETLAILRRYPWPGNIRELENALEMATILCGKGVIGPEHLSQRLVAAMEGDAGKTRKAAPADLVPTSMRDLEAEALRQALHKYDGNIMMVARQLGLSRSTIYRKMKENGISKSVSVHCTRL